jgi:glutathione S-transferase
LSLNIERRDAQKDGENRTDLIQGYGQPKVPCLKITDPAGSTQWLVESGAIIAYLRGRFATSTSVGGRKRVAKLSTCGVSRTWLFKQAYSGHLFGLGRDRCSGGRAFASRVNSCVF